MLPAILVFAAPAAQAQTAWDAATDDWFVDGNWTAGEPDANTGAIIDNGGTAQIQSPGAESAELTVGDTNTTDTSFLAISQGGSLATSDLTTIGAATDTSGDITVTGTDSAWTTVDASIYVGDFGTGTLTVSDGGQIERSDTVGGITVGFRSGSSGELVITGSGSSVDHGNLRIGRAGDGVLTISDGGEVYSASASLGMITGTGEATVTGMDSLWEHNNFSVGHSITGSSGATGTLNIEASGTVNTLFHGTIADGEDTTGTVTVNGAGTAWNIERSLTVGNQGDGTLNIENGGSVASGQNDSEEAVIGNQAGSTGNVTVTGPDSSWNSGGTLFVGFEGTGTLNVEDGGTVNNSRSIIVGHDGIGELNIESGGTVVTGLAGSVGEEANGQGTVLVTGAGSTWSSSSALYIGNRGDGEMTVEAGGSVSNTSGYIGFSTGTQGAVTVTGAGSEWDNSGILSIGYAGTGELNIEDGGTVLSNSAAYIGQSVGQGSVTVTGTDSEWTNDGALNVGHAGDGTLTIQNSGSVSSNSVIAGSDDTGSGTITVDDAELDVADKLAIGGEGNGTLNILNGGDVTSHQGIIGEQADGVGNVAVDGANSQWTMSNRIIVGQIGEGTLEITDGGAVDSAFSFIGGTFGSQGEVTVTGTDSSWDAGSSLVVGSSGTGSLDIQDNGLVSSGSGTIAVSPNAEGHVTVGSDGSWTMSDELVVADGGSGTLTIESGGVVGNTHGRIGVDSDAEGTVTVTGTGSEWANSDTLSIGRSGTGTLNIENGGMVSSTAGFIGTFANSGGTASINDADWSLSQNLFVGDRGSGTLVIENGGVVSNSFSRIGNDADADGTVTVSGTGSLWNQSSSLTVGLFGTGELSIDNGGEVSNTAGVIGDRAGSEGIVTVAGSGSAWDNDFALTVGAEGTGTLEIGAGAEVSADSVTVAQDAGSSGTVRVNGTLTGTGGVQVNAGGWLGGDGMVTGNTTVAGTVAPGNSIGVLDIDGDYTQAAGSTYIVEVNDAGDTAGVNNDLIDVTGTANIDAGATVHVTPENGTDDGSTYAPETTYTILTAAGGVNGEFGSVTDDFAFLFPQLAYDANNVFLTLVQGGDFDTVAETPNQLAVATTFNDLVGSGQVDELLGTLIMLNADDARDFLDSLSGVQHTHAQTQARQVGQRFRGLMFGRMSNGGVSLAGGGAGLAMAGERWAHQLDANLRARDGQRGRNAGDGMAPERGLWLRGFGGFGDIDSTRNAAGADYKTGGVAVGIDTEIGRDWLAGVAFSYARSDIDSAGGSLDVDSFQLAGYGGWRASEVYLNGALSLGYHHTDASRPVNGASAEADYDSFSASIATEIGRDVPIAPNTTVTPFIGLEYSHLARESFTESGAGQANLAVSGEDEDSLRSSLGVRLGHAFVTDGGMDIEPMIYAAYVREYMDSVSRLDAGFEAAPDNRFVIAGPDLDRDRAAFGAGINARLSARSALNLAYDGEVAGSHDNHSFSATYRLSW